MKPAARDMAILLVDDEREFVLTLAERLRLRGYRVHVALNGESALAFLSSENSEGERGADLIDLVLLDMFLPGMHGLEVLRNIHAMRENLPVVMLTGQAETGQGVEGLKEGAWECLSKPLELRKLLELLDTLQKEKAHA